MLNSPLEQFQILPIISLPLVDITNAFAICGLSIGCFFFLHTCLNIYGLSFIPKAWQSFVESLYEAVSGLVLDTVGKEGQKYFPFLFSLFCFVLLSNLLGLVPYSFTTTSHLIQTMTLALMVFIGVNIICLSIHGFHMVSLFYPPGTSLGLAFLLVPIEIVSYLFRPISLAVRLFANMMAGHTLLKVIGGFAWAMMGGGTFLFLAHFLPLIILVLLMGLEMGVAIIQAYVFTILSTIYLNDAIKLH
uniref:ATP synthase subunit a n=1 Tax=Schizocladia ischiensis TaxID=196139 RepID=A0A7S6UA32_9STRA|nr:Atp6 [Schizocladia ischiensis]QOW07600.1 Atp6 [Schizocladia ischiensis]